MKHLLFISLLFWKLNCLAGGNYPPSPQLTIIVNNEIIPPVIVNDTINITISGEDSLSLNFFFPNDFKSSNVWLHSGIAIQGNNSLSLHILKSGLYKFVWGWGPDIPIKVFIRDEIIKNYPECAIYSHKLIKGVWSLEKKSTFDQNHYTIIDTTRTNGTDSIGIGIFAQGTICQDSLIDKIKFQWYFNDYLVENLDSSFIKVNSTGNYKVIFYMNDIQYVLIFHIENPDNNNQYPFCRTFTSSSKNGKWTESIELFSDGDLNPHINVENFNSQTLFLTPDQDLKVKFYRGGNDCKRNSTEKITWKESSTYGGDLQDMEENIDSIIIKHSGYYYLLYHSGKYYYHRIFYVPEPECSLHLTYTINGKLKENKYLQEEPIMLSDKDTLFLNMFVGGKYCEENYSKSIYNYTVYSKGKIEENFLGYLTIKDTGRVQVFYNAHYLSGEYSYFIKKSLPTSNIQPLEINDKVTVYPNPATETLQINFTDLKEAEVQYRIMNNIGQEILSGKLLNSKTTCNINVHEINAGIYYLKIMTEEGVIIKKFMKTN